MATAVGPCFPVCMRGSRILCEKASFGFVRFLSGSWGLVVHDWQRVSVLVLDLVNGFRSIFLDSKITSTTNKKVYNDSLTKFEGLRALYAVYKIACCGLSMSPPVFSYLRLNIMAMTCKGLDYVVVLPLVPPRYRRRPAVNH